MACNTSLIGLSKPCNSNSLGLLNLYLLPREYFIPSAATLSTGTNGGSLTALTLSGSAKFVEFAFPKKGANYNEEATITPESLAVSYAQTITVTLPYREKAKRQALALLTAGLRDLVAIVKDMNGKYFFFGYANSVNLSAMAGGSEDGVYKVTLLGDEPEQAPEVDSTLIAAIVTPAS